MIKWEQVDWVFLDMDGTLLDLHFDNHFWLNLVPEQLAHRDFNHLPFDQAIDASRAAVYERYQSVQGTLDWYSTEYWNQTLQLPIMELSQQQQHRIRYRYDSEQFLKWLKQQNMQVVILTNAHPDNLHLKHQVTGLLDYVDMAISAHQVKYPKENPLFWPALSQHLPFDPNRTLLIDDNESVLSTAVAAGIAQVLCISQPDTTQQSRIIPDFPAITCFHEIIQS
ncbi:GMP/IMP nucleotidase [Gynuella sp.]|uniref:GMP/IMP nucleotidase n=1 Tax=Gynuella sp. TaxID=2969146 RepID=UPI003D0DE4C8